MKNLDQPTLFGKLASAESDPSPRPERSGQAKVTYGSTRDILTRSTGFLDAYDFTLNPYTGCTFGCTYCYAAFFSYRIKERDSWGYWVRVKENAADSLRRRRRGSLDGKTIYMSSVTDPYQPVERKLKLTRSLLEILAERHKPKLVVQTRSPDVVRDADLYRKIVDGGGRVQVNMTVTTDDEDIRRTFEPYCPANRRRLGAIKALHQAGLQCCITMTPLLWVEEPDTFADLLLDTGITDFIVQPFHFKRGRFVAGTRDSARELMAQKLGCSVAAFPGQYLDHYSRVQHVLDNRLSKVGNLGEGKDGFRPPF